MKVAVISLGSKSSLMVANALKKYFDIVDSIDIRDIEVSLSGERPEVLYAGKPLGKYNCIYAKGSFRYEPLLRSITAALYKDCYMPIKATAFTVGHDKLLTQLDMQQHKIPMPITYISSTTEAAKKILKKVNYPIIMKFPSGTGGKGVMYAESFAAASSMLDALTALRQPFIIQEYVETSGVDIRAIVVGDRVVAAMKRKAEIGEKRANIHAGGAGEACTLDTYTKKIAVDAAKAIGADICGVDMLESVKGPLVIEVNVSPGLQGITAATKIDVADKIAGYLYEKTREFTESGKKIGAKEILNEIETKPKEIITSLDFRGNRILLPELITKITGFSDKEEFSIKGDKDGLIIKRFGVGERRKG